MLASTSAARPTADKLDLDIAPSVGTVCRFSHNETIFAIGDEAKFSYKVTNGAVRLVKRLVDGRRHIAGFQLPGDVFGIEWTDTYALTAEAVGDVVAIRYAYIDLDEFSELRAEVRSQMLAALLRDLRVAQDHLVSLGCRSAKERVASFLLMLSSRGGEDGAIEMPMGREDIADYLGLTVETVCRTLHELQKIGIIAIPNRREIVVLSDVTLRTIAGR